MSDGMGVFIDILPQLESAAFGKMLTDITGRFTKASTDIGKVFGKDIGADAARGVGTARASMERDLLSIQTAADRTEQAWTRAANREVIALGKVDAAQAKLTETEKKYAAGSSQVLEAQTRLTKAQQDHERATAIRQKSDAAMVSTSATLANAEDAHRAAVEKNNSSIGKMSSAASIAGVAITGGLVVALGAGVKAAGDFQETQMRLVTTAGLSKASLDQVSQGILQMAGQVGISANDLSTAMYTVSSGMTHVADPAKDAANALAILKAGAQGAAQEGAPLKDVVDAVTTTMKDYGPAAGSAAEITSRMITAVSHGKTTFGEFSGALGQVQAAAGQAHVPLNDLYADMAQMTVHGIGAEQAAQNLNRAITTLQKPSADMTTSLSAIGINSADLADDLGSKGLSGTLEMISEAVMNKMGPSGKVMISALNQSQAAAADTKKAFDALPPSLQAIASKLQSGSLSHAGFIADLKGLPEQQAAVLRQWDEMNNKATGLSSKLTGLKNSDMTYKQMMIAATGNQETARVAANVTGADNQADIASTKNAEQDAKPDANGDVAGSSDVQGNFNQKMKDLKEGFHSFEIELGEKVLPVATKFVGWLQGSMSWLEKHKQLIKDIALGLGPLAAGITAIVVATKIWTTAQAALNLILDANPVVLIVAGIVALGVGIYEAYKHCKTFRDIVADVWDWIKKWWKELLILTGPIGLVIDGIVELVKHFGDVKKWVADLWKDMKSWGEWLGHEFTSIWHDIEGVFDKVMSGIKTGFTDTVSAAKTIWNELSKAMGEPVYAVVQYIYNDGIRRVWNDVVNAFGLSSIDLPEVDSGKIPHFADGGVHGVMSGYSPGVDDRVIAVGGGEAIMRPEWTRAIGSGYVNAANAAARSGGVSGVRDFITGGGAHYAFGGIHMGDSILGDIGNVIGDVGHGVAHVAKSAYHTVANAAEIVANPIGYIHKKLDGLIGKVAGGGAEHWIKVLTQAPTHMISTVIDWVKRHLGMGDSGSSSNGALPASIANNQQLISWVHQAEALTGVDDSWTQDLLRTISRESSGNVHAINLTDSNAQAGHPSKGLTQTIDSTFQAYHQPGTSDDVYDPVANIAASINYQKARYHGDHAGVAAAHNYALGGIAHFDGGGINVPGWDPTLSQFAGQNTPAPATPSQTEGQKLMAAFVASSPQLPTPAPAPAPDDSTATPQVDNTDAGDDSGSPAPVGAAPGPAPTPAPDPGTAAPVPGISPDAMSAATGGGGAKAALDAIQAHASTMYQWGGSNLATGVDCSGLLSAAQNIAEGAADTTKRLGNTMSMLNGTWPHLLPGASSSDAMAFGANSEHTAGTILGTNVEARQSGEPIRIGAQAVGAWDKQFTNQFHVDPKFIGSGDGGSDSPEDDAANQQEAAKEQQEAQRLLDDATKHDQQAQKDLAEAAKADALAQASTGAMRAKHQSHAQSLRDAAQKAKDAAARDRQDAQQHQQKAKDDLAKHGKADATKDGKDGADGGYVTFHDLLSRGGGILADSITQSTGFDKFESILSNSKLVKIGLGLSHLRFDRKPDPVNWFFQSPDTDSTTDASTGSDQPASLHDMAGDALANAVTPGLKEPKGQLDLPSPGKNLGLGKNQPKIKVHDDGGWIEPGDMALNLSNRPEPVLSGSQLDNVSSVANLAAMLPGMAGLGPMMSGAKALINVENQIINRGDEHKNARENARSINQYIGSGKR